MHRLTPTKGAKQAQCASSPRSASVPPQPQQFTKRRTLLLGLSLPLAIPGFGGNPTGPEQTPQFGDCFGCIGPGNLGASKNAGSLAPCLDPRSGGGDFGACLSSYDDRPAHFAYPWEFDETRTKAIEKLKRTVARFGGKLQKELNEDYLYFTLYNDERDETFDLEFLFAENDNTVSVRIAARRPDDSAAKKRAAEFLGDLRRALFWTDVPILRNRKRALIVIESPFDEFGPEGPPTFDDAIREELDLGAVKD